MKVKSGFTLIELSIVLVIISLIVGGILVGQDLIRAAEIRATISQLEKYQTAVNTFRNKYGGLPGDMLYTQACAFGFFCFPNYSPASQQGAGDGNGFIQGPAGNGMFQPTTFQLNAPDNVSVVATEQVVFWRHLSDANLVDGSFGNASLLNGNGNPLVYTTNVSPYFPLAKVGRGNYFLVAADGEYNYFLLGYVVGIGGGGWGGASPPVAGLSPLEAYNIDIKIDDGLPNTGRVTAMFYNLNVLDDPASWASTPVSGDCTTGGASGTDPTAVYNVNTSTGGTAYACAMVFRFD